MISKIIFIGSSPITSVYMFDFVYSCSLIRLKCHIANMKILVQFQSRVLNQCENLDEWQSGYCGDLLSLGFF